MLDKSHIRLMVIGLMLLSEPPLPNFVRVFWAALKSLNPDCCPHPINSKARVNPFSVILKSLRCWPQSLSTFLTTVIPNPAAGNCQKYVGVVVVLTNSCHCLFLLKVLLRLFLPTFLVAFVETSPSHKLAMSKYSLMETPSRICSSVLLHIHWDKN